MKKESKVAWPQDHPFSRLVLEALRAGRPIEHSSILAAVDDGDHEKVFDLSSSEPLKKENFVIFQYGVFLRKPDGRVAVFQRDRIDQGNERITTGNSMLLSRSTPDHPFHAIPRLIEDTLCVGGQSRLGKFERVGMAWNHVSPKRGKSRAPIYLFALYCHHFPDGLPLHGRFRDLADELVGFYEASQLPGLFQDSGYLDQYLARSLAKGELVAESMDESFLFAPDSYVACSETRPDSFESRAYAKGYNVFISHVSDDSFSALGLYYFLLQESSRGVFPRLDLIDLPEGEKTSKIDRMIDECDCLVLVITPLLLERSRQSEKRGAKDWVRYEVERAQAQGKPVLGFTLGQVRRPAWFPPKVVVNKKDNHTDWLKEVAGLVARIQSVCEMRGAGSVEGGTDV